MKTLAIYLGPWKTGSTSVRRALSDGRDVLANLDVESPSMGEGGLSWMLYDRKLGRRAEGRQADLFASFQDPSIDWGVIWRAERERVATSPLSRVVVASEFLHACPDPEQAFCEVKRDQTIAVCCVRNRIDMANAGIAELVRDPWITIAQAREAAVANAVDYADVERRWSPVADLAFIPYGTNAADEVLTALGAGAASISSRRDNRSPPASAIAYLYQRKAEQLGRPDWGRVCEAFLRSVADCGREFASGSLLGADSELDVRADVDFVASRPEFANVLKPDHREQATIDPKAQRAFDLFFRRAIDEA